MEMPDSRFLFCVSVRVPSVLLHGEVFKEEGFISSLDCLTLGL